MNNKFLAVALVAVLGLVGILGTAMAEECPDRTQTNEQTNAKFMKEGIALAEQALEHARQGHGPETKASTKEALAKFRCIVTTTGESKMQAPKIKIKKAGIEAGKGNVAAAVPLLEEGIAALQKVDMTPKGLGD